MRFSLATLALAVLALASAACEPQRRDVQIDWTFGAGAGQGCAAAGVATIEIDIAGELVSPNQFACAGAYAAGVDLGRFLVGDYDVRITGLDAGGNLTYQTIETIRVVESQSPNVFNIVVPAFSGSDGGQGDLTLFWSFAGKSCAAAGVSSVQVSLDGTPVTDFDNSPDLPCTDHGTDGITIGPIPSGTHSLILTATGAGSISYSDTLSANIADQFETQLSPDLAASTATGGTTATAELSWSFAGMSCADAQVDSVTVYVDGTSQGSLPCSNSGSDGGTVTGLAAGAHTITISGVRGTGVAAQLVYSSAGAGTQGQFQAGVTTHLLLSAPATTPGVGGATLTLAFPAGGPSCAASSGAGTTITYTLTSPAGVARAPASFTCGGSAGGTAIAICDPGAAGCGAGNSGLTAGVWTIAASTAGYSASQPFSVPNDAVGAATINFSAQ